MILVMNHVRLLLSLCYSVMVLCQTAMNHSMVLWSSGYVILLQSNIAMLWIQDDV